MVTRISQKLFQSVLAVGLLISMPYANGMKLKEAIRYPKPDSSEPIAEFPSYVYCNVYQGASYDWSEKEIKDLRKQTRSLDSSEVREDLADEKLDLKEALSYVNALDKIETMGLLKKSFAKWTIEDIKQVNAWLTQLVVDEPGKFRKEKIVWLNMTRQLNSDEVAPTVSKLKKGGFKLGESTIGKLKTGESVYFHNRNEMYFCDPIHFSRPDQIKGHLEALLKTIQGLIKNKSSHIIDLAACLHAEVVAIHPFKEANKRTGRLLSNVVLMQAGYDPVAYNDGEPYLEKLVDGIKKKNNRALSRYLTQLIAEQKKRKCKKS